MPTLHWDSRFDFPYSSFQKSRFDICTSSGFLVQFSAFEFFAGNFDRIMSVIM